MTPETSTPTTGEALTERLFAAMLAGIELLSVELGRRLGLYRELADGGPATSVEFAARAGIAERYAREWLEQQAAAGILAVASPAMRRPGGSSSRPRTAPCSSTRPTRSILQAGR